LGEVWVERVGKVGKEVGGSVIPKVAGRGRNRKKLHNIVSLNYFAMKKGRKGGGYRNKY